MSGPIASLKAIVHRLRTHSDASTTTNTTAEPKPQFNQDMTTHHDDDINAISEVFAEKIDNVRSFTDIPLSDHQTDDTKETACSKCIIL